jgi:hydrogenase expression/formation protein HypE
MRELIEQLFLPAFANQTAAARHDSVVIPIDGTRIAFTTDSYVVSPLFFPGGDIGTLAVYGTVNDLAMAGANPLYLSAGFILEEGLPLDTLARIVESMRRASRRCGIELVTGDTKVVDRGKGDGVFINTSGMGRVPLGIDIRPQRVQPGDAVLLNGDVGRHGVAIMSVREGLGFETTLESDCAPLHELIADLVTTCGAVHCLRDLTRGGLASALNEIALDARVDIEVDGDVVPVDPAVLGACEILGLDPFYVANEGRCIVFVPETESRAALAAMRKSNPVACRIGKVLGSGSGRVVVSGRYGVPRVLDLLSGEQLPRIC